MVVMGTITGDQEGAGGDLVLLAVVAAVLLVGSFATQVSTRYAILKRPAISLDGMGVTGH